LPQASNTCLIDINSGCTLIEQWMQYPSTEGRLSQVFNLPTQNGPLVSQRTTGTPILPNCSNPCAALNTFECTIIHDISV
jgi:hypothetical protein